MDQPDTVEETTTEPAPSGSSTAKGSPIKRFLPLIVLVALIVIAFALGLHKYLSFDVLQENREGLLAFVADNPVGAPLAFMAIYAAVVALSLPGGAILTIIGGFLFGGIQGGLVVVAAATVGATTLFLIARSSLGATLHERAGPWLQKMEAGFQENALSYLLVLRLVPLFPFFVVNLVPAFLGVTTRTYVIATFFGIIPGTFVYALVGNGLGALLDAGEKPDLGIIFDPEILAPLIGLAVLAMIPVGYKWWKSRKG